MNRFAPIISVVLLLVLLTSTVPPAKACGPSFVEPVFAFATRPDLELQAYASGQQLGIVKSTYNRSFLFAAYRNFNNVPFSPIEQKELVKVWNAELYNTDESESGNAQAVKNWIAARKKVLTDEAEPKIYTARQNEGGYDFFPNCTTNAFEVAIKTLDNRVIAHGANSEDVKNWTRAQDTVFSNCSEGKILPSETSIGAPAWLIKDRAYQMAAASFYGANFDDAKVRFEQIAVDKQSVWQPLANYLVARTLLRQASLMEDDDEKKLLEKRRPFYEQAEIQLQKVLTDRTQNELHPAATKLFNLIKYRLHPQERVHELAIILSGKAENPSLRLDLIDYRWLLDRFNLSSDETVADKISVGDLQTDDLTDWIVTFQSQNANALNHSIEKWRATKSAAWLVSALSKSNKDGSETAQLISAAENISQASSAFATIAFHQNRLLIESGKIAEARSKLDLLLNNKTSTFSISARNAFASQRMMLAENLDEFLTFSQRRAAAFALDGLPGETEDLTPPKEGEDYNKNEREWLNRTMFDADSVRIFNEQMPLAVLKAAAQNSKLPVYLKRNLLVAAWTKAILLERDETAQELAPNLARLAPEFAPVLTQYLNAQTPIERSNAALYVLLKYPALRPVAESGYGRLTPVSEIDSYRDNWWCAPSDFIYNDAGEKIELTQLPVPTFLAADGQSKVASRERQQLQKLGNGATYLARRAVEFATKFPADPRVPESLYLAIKSTRYGCTDCDTGKYSKAAFDLLKIRFAASEWKKKTPYWFKDESCEQK